MWTEPHALKSPAEIRQVQWRRDDAGEMSLRVVEADRNATDPFSRCLRAERRRDQDALLILVAQYPEMRQIGDAGTDGVAVIGMHQHIALGVGPSKRVECRRAIVKAAQRFFR